MTRERRRLITFLCCEVLGAGFVAASPLASLALWLPSLTDIDLHMVNLECDPHELSLLYGGFAHLPYLEQLTLPSCKALTGIGALAGNGSCSLRGLEVWDIHSHRYGPPYPQRYDVTGLSQLHGLKTLLFVNLNPEFVDIGRAACVSLLSASLPPSLENLELRAARELHSSDTSISISLQQGGFCWTAINPALTLRDFLGLAAEVLLPGFPVLAVPQQRQRQLQSPWEAEPPPPPSRLSPTHHLDIGTIDIPHDVALTARDAAILADLRLRFRSISLGALRFGVCAGPHLSGAQLRAACLLAQTLAAPASVSVQVPTRAVSDRLGLHFGSPSFSFALSAGAAAPPGGAAGWGGAQAAEEPAAAAAAASMAAAAAGGGPSVRQRPRRLAPSVLPSLTAAPERPNWEQHDSMAPYVPGSAAAAMLCSALDRMVLLARDRTAAQEAARLTSLSGWNADGGRGGGNGGERMALVLLRGPFIASLCQSPVGLEPWLALLEWYVATPDADAASDGSGSVDGGGSSTAARGGGYTGSSGLAYVHRKRIRTYQLVPSAGALLLGCEERAVHALIAAAPEAAALHYSRRSAAAPAAPSASASSSALPTSAAGQRAARGGGGGGGGGSGGGALEAAALGIKWTWGVPDPYCAASAPLQEWLLYNVGQAMQARHLRGTGGSGPTSQVQVALICALLVRDELATELPPAVVLQW